MSFSTEDDSENSTTAMSSVSVVDTTAPQVSCGVAKPALWPPNHELVDVGLQFTAEDVCDPSPLEVQISVTSDEPSTGASGDGGAIHCADAVVDGQSVWLRAERDGSGDGRIYTIGVSATDAQGNVGSCSTTLGVPKSQGAKGEAVDSGQVFSPELCPEP